jgi:RHS repeat-associated protein
MIRKIFTCFLVILLTISSINIGGFARLSGNKVEAKKAINIPKTIEKIKELEELRENNTKTFINSDGTYTKEIFTEDIHFKENGKFKNISNTPEVNNEDDKGDFKYKNKDNRFSVKFAKDTKKKNLYKLKLDKETVNFQLLNPQSTTAKSEEGIITYEDILENVDIKYSIGNSNIKEDIYLKNKDSERKFQFFITGSLEPKKEKGTILFYNKENQVVWVMIPPFMEDANGKYSEDITMDVEKSKNGYIVTMVPDSKFLDDKETKFPVRIDPSVNIGGTSSNTLDTYVMSSYPSNNYNLTPELRTGYTSSTGITRSYMDFTESLPNLTGKLLVKAELKLYKWNDIGTVSPTNVYANRITNSWNNSTITYGTQPTLDTSQTYGSTSATGSAKWLSMDVTSLVNGWLNGTYPNNGVALRSTSEGTAGSYQKYNSSETASNKPYLAITYSEKPTVPSAAGYSKNNGTGYVNLTWAPISGATGYKVLLYNGSAYDELDVGNVTSWSTLNKKIWPTKAQIDSGQYTMRKNGDGRELPENPSYLYLKNTGVYKNDTIYWFAIKAYNSYGTTELSPYTRTPIPDQTKPTVPAGVQITNNLIDSFTIGWQPATDPDGSGVAKYKVFLGDQPNTPNIVNGEETTNLSYTSKGLTSRKTYYAWVQAVDKSSNISDNSLQVNTIARKQYEALISNPIIPHEINIDNETEPLIFEVENTGISPWTNDLNINLSVTSSSPDKSTDTGFVGYLNTGEVIKTGDKKTFKVKWKPQKGVIGSYQIKAVVGKGTDPVPINPTENFINQTIEVKDLVPPTGQININGGNLYTTEKRVQIYLNQVKDNAVGNLYVQLANGPKDAITKDLSFSEPILISNSGPLNWELQENEGIQYVYARIKDQSGNESVSSASIIYDHTFPTIKLTNMNDGDFISGTKKIIGTITDQDLVAYKLEYRNMNDQNFTWNLIIDQQNEVTDATLAEWDTSSLPKGEYEVRISATDGAGHTNLLSKTIWIDNFDKKWTGSESFYPTYPINLLDGNGFVNLYNGSLNIQEVDFSLPATGFSLALGRSYSSNLHNNGLLGKGWYSNLDEHLVFNTNDVEYYDPDGTVHRFNLLADGKFSTPTGTSYKLTFGDTNLYELTEKNGSLSTKRFNRDGRVEKIVDTNGNSIQYQYENERLKSITSSTKSITLNYNDDHTIESAVFSTGEKVSYFYNGGYLTDTKIFTKSGKLSSSTHYDYQDGKMQTVVSENGLKVEFGFNGNRLVQTKTKRSTRVVDETKNFPEKTYDSIIDKFSYNLTTNKIYSTIYSINSNKTSKNLANTEFELNKEGNLSKQNIIRTYVENEDPEAANQDKKNILLSTEYEQNRLMATTDGKGNRTTYEYDGYGNVLKTHLPTVTVNGVMSAYVLENKYNDRGQINQAYNTIGQVKEWKYDSKGNVEQITDEEGNVQHFEYDSFGNVKKSMSERGPLYSYLPDYSMEAKTLSDWKVQGTVTKVTTQAKTGKQSIEIAPNGVLETNSIAIKKGRLPVLAMLEGMAPSGTATLDVKLQFLKDDTIIKEYTETNSLTGNWSKKRVNGAVPAGATHVRVQVSNSGAVNLFVDDLVLEETGLETTYIFDQTGENVKETIDPYGNKTSYTYNKYGQPLTETNSLNQTQSIEYDDQQRVKVKKDRVGRVTSFEYDDMDNVKKETNSLDQVTEYQYNEWGQLVHKILPAVEMTSYKDETVDHVEQKQAHLYFEYDELGRKMKENVEYDVNDNTLDILSQEYDGYGKVARSIDPMQNQKYFSYDKNGNNEHTIDFAAKPIQVGEGQEKFLIAKGEMYASYDEWNRQITETDNTGNRDVLTMTNTYDSESHLIHTKDAEGTEFHYTFNALDENIYTKDNSTPVVETWSYFDGLGNPAITISGNTVEYAVTDANGNLLETIDHKGTKTTFEYNAVGDKVKQTNPDGTTIDWTYNEEGQIKSETQKVEDKEDTTTYLVTTYHYTDAAEVDYQKLESQVNHKDTKKTDKSLLKETELKYDAMGRIVRELSKVYEANSSQFKKSDVRFLYDLKGNLIHKWIYDESSQTVLKNSGTIYPFVRSESNYKFDANNRFLLEEKVENGIVMTKTYKDDENAETIKSAIGSTTVYYNANDLAEKVYTPASEMYQFLYTASESINMVKGPRLTVNMDYGRNEKMSLIKTIKKDTTNVLFSEEYLYNAEEQIESATNPLDGKKEYTYTPEGFLKTVKKGTETLNYSYDSSGNLLKTVNETGKVFLDNQYGQGNRITSSIQFDTTNQKYKKVTYAFRPDGSLLKESTTKAVDTYEAAKTAAIDVEKEYDYASINLLMGITTKKNGTVTEKVEYTYDSEDNRSTKKVTNGQGSLTEFYYYDPNGDLVSISQQSGIDQVQNLMNFYRDASGQLLSFKYQDQMFDYVYNQRGDIVAIANNLGEIIARYTYDEWGNLLKIDAATPLGKEIANVNPYRYVGKFGVQYDNNTQLYFMGWRDYDSKIGRYLVADEYEGEDTNPVSFNRYLYAESDPVNNIDPDGYAPKWLKKLTKGVKKAAKATYNFAIGDDIKTLTSKNTKWYQKAGAAISIASNFIPGGGVVSKAAKLAIKGTAKAVKAVKVSKAVVKAAKVVKAPAKKAAAVVNKKPKVMPASSIKSTPKIQSPAPAKVSASTPVSKPKVASTPKSERGKVLTPAEKNACANGQCSNPNLGQCFISGTKVITEKGNKPIQEIQVGDKVLSQDVETGEKDYKEVKQLFVHEVDTLVHVKIKGTKISNTEEHPYWVDGKGWVEAKNLHKGDRVVLANGEKASVESVTKEKLATPVKVYNFEVADWHTYFVADLGVLVHNDCSPKGTDKIDKVLTKNGAFRDAKRRAGIPNSTQHKKPVDVFDGTTENRRVYEFEVDGNKKYIIEHREDKFGRGPHFHGADDLKGSPLEKGRYNQYPGHSPEDFIGYK